MLIVGVLSGLPGGHDIEQGRGLGGVAVSVAVVDEGGPRSGP
jgi:hypothetical protein